MRMVRHSNVDRWPGDLIHASGCVAGLRAHPETVWICFFAFWLLNMFVIWKGINTIRLLEGVAAPLMLAVGILLLWWITNKAGGFGPVFSAPAKFRDNAEFFRFFIPSLTGWSDSGPPSRSTFPTSPATP